MDHSKPRGIVNSILWMCVGVVLGLFIINEFLHPIKTSEILTLAVIAAAGSALAFIQGGISLAQWMKDKANFAMATAIYQAFLLHKVIRDSELEDKAKVAYATLVNEKKVKKPFDDDRFKEAVFRLSFEGNICSERSGDLLWWKTLQSSAPTSEQDG